ncbi:MAG: flagellar protein FlgN [Pseudomonadales bacterium]|nr:flagellar protein FlgN [Pseudomonadales bacterium]MCP5331361.1 flagellar protein FlgN [Pseudomonadales bacterium]MCP5344370.1 flagellar protein FlgN [Pseudomonadales bacterium]
MSNASMQALLEQDLYNASQLENLLRSERHQLESRDIGALSQTLIDKAQLLAQIEANDDARRKLLASLRKCADNNGLRDYCQQEGLGELYQKLLTSLQHCTDLSNINGAIVHRSKLNNRHLLDILQGKTSQPGVYDQRGDASTTSDTRAIARA